MQCLCFHRSIFSLISSSCLVVVQSALLSLFLLILLCCISFTSFSLSLSLLFSRPLSLYSSLYLSFQRMKWPQASAHMFSCQSISNYTPFPPTFLLTILCSWHRSHFIIFPREWTPVCMLVIPRCKNRNSRKSQDHGVNKKFCWLCTKKITLSSNICTRFWESWSWFVLVRYQVWF